MAAKTNGRRKRQIIYRVLLCVYLIVLFYLLFFSERMGRADNIQDYRYNLTLFREIMRFYNSRALYPRAFVLNVIGNVVAFMPFGYLLPRMNARCRNPFFTVLFSFCLSLGVEAVQLVFKLGCFDVDDLLLNTLGGFLGYLIFLLFSRQKVGQGGKKDAVS